MLVFLRGITAPSRGVAAIKPPRAFIEALDDILAGQAGHAARATHDSATGHGNDTSGEAMA